MVVSCEVRDEIPKTINMLFAGNTMHLLTLSQTLIEPLYETNEKSECSNYRGIILISVGGKMLSMRVFMEVRDAVDKI